MPEFYKQPRAKLLAVVRKSGCLLLSISALGCLMLSLMGAVSVGSMELSPKEVLYSLAGCSDCGLNPVAVQVVWDIRLPRALMAMLTGAGLSACGAILQSVTRNPLADPYLFGISSGASLGAVTAMTLVSGGVISITTGSLLGASFSVVLMLSLAGRAAVQVERLLLSGVAVSFMLSAFTGLILYYSSPEIATTLLFWMMGSFSNSQWDQLAMPTVTLGLGISLFFVYRRWLAAVQAGDESALTLGVPVNQLRLFMLIVCAAITAVLVAQVGGIGFVGLMIPHISRALVGAQIHRILLMSLLLGAVFMVCVDVLARSLLVNQVLPVGIVTSAIGSLFFFIILKQRRSRI